ncbi:MAG: AAA family ATPase, partial [Candidatus Cryptobacteroides sp.]
MLYPIGIQNFEKLREGGYTYVDKTALIYKLATSGTYYFLSRPRRFGKSLLISTMDAYFSGKKDLFKGLALEQLENDWIEYPVLHLDLNGKKYDCPQALINNINYHFTLWDKNLDADTSSVNDIEVRFKQIIDIAYEKTGKKVVILIDEYDKP